MEAISEEKEGRTVDTHDYEEDEYPPTPTGARAATRRASMPNLKAFTLSSDSASRKNFSVHRTSIFIRQNKPRCKRRPLQVLMLTICLLLVLIQLGIFNIYFMLYGDEQREQFVDNSTHHFVECDTLRSNQQKYLAWNFWLYFLAPDVLAAVAMACLPLCAARQLYLERVKKEVQCGKLDRSLRYAGICYGLYAIALISKVAVSSKSFLMVLQRIEDCGVHRMLGLNTFILILGLTCIIFFMIVFAHHAHNLIVEEWLKRLVEKVTFDLLDGVHFLQMVFSHEAAEFMLANPHLENLIIALSCINFALPAVSLLKMRQKIVNTDSTGDSTPTPSSSPSALTLDALVLDVEKSSRKLSDGDVAKADSGISLDRGSMQNIPPSNLVAHLDRCLSSNYKSAAMGLKAPPAEASKAENWTAFIESEVYDLLFLLLINVPYLCVRCYLWHIMTLELSVFILKNAIEIIIQSTKVVQGIRHFSRWH